MWWAVGPSPNFTPQGGPSCPRFYLARRKGFRKANGTHQLRSGNVRVETEGDGNSAQNPVSLPGEQGAGKASLDSGLLWKSLTQPCLCRCSRCCFECCCLACCCLPPAWPASTSCPCCVNWPAAWAPRTCERLCWAVCCSSSARDARQMLGWLPERPTLRGGRG